MQGDQAMSSVNTNDENHYLIKNTSTTMKNHLKTYFGIPKPIHNDDYHWCMLLSHIMISKYT